MDAKATSISVTFESCSTNGAISLTITDNGCGIEKQDFSSLCERFCTSKLVSYEDLFSSTFDTFGFRGEALASISIICERMTVRSCRNLIETGSTSGRNGEIAYIAEYDQGKMISLNPCAGLPGTFIRIENLFFHDPVRRTKLKSPSEEYSSILTVIKMYAIQMGGKIGFNCSRKSVLENANFTGKICHPSVDLFTRQEQTKLQVIQDINNTELTDNLIAIEIPDASLHAQLGNIGASNKILPVIGSGLISQVSYHALKKAVFILFINNRLIDDTTMPLRNSIIQYYSSLLLKKSHPWIYLSLIIEPDKIDVNVHPTKKNVLLVDEKEIIEIILMTLENTLKRDTKSICDSTSIASERSCVNEKFKDIMSRPSSTFSPSTFIRTDTSSQTLFSSFSQSGMTKRWKPTETLTISKSLEGTAGPMLTSILELRSDVLEYCDDGNNTIFTEFSD